MKQFIKHISIFICIFIHFCVAAQSVAYTNFMSQNDLPSNTVYQIKQDKNGFIWIATANGLARYDGSNFKVFNPKGIKDKEILGMLIDDNGKVWFWNLKGKLFYIFNNVIKEIKFKKNTIKIRDFKQDNDGTYFFIAQGIGVYRLNKNYTYKQIAQSELAEKIIKTNKGLLLNIRDFIYDISYDTIQFRYNFYLPIFEKGIKKPMIFKEMNHEYWCLQQWTDELYKIDENGKLIDFGFVAHRNQFKDGIKMIYEDNNHQYWVILKDKLLVFDATEQHLISQIYFPLANKVTNFLHDREGNYWLTLSDNGIIFIPSIHIKSQLKLKNEITNNFTIQSLAVYDNQLIISKNQGNITLTDFNTEQEKHFSFKHNLPIQNIKKGFNGDIWLISNIKATIVNKDFKIIEDNVGDQIIGYKSIYFDNVTEDIFIGHYDGVLKITKEEFNDFIDNKKFEWGSIRQRFRVNGINQRVYAIEKVKNEYWFGSTDGLYECIDKKAKLTSIPELQKSWITHIINQNDTVWVGTQTDGLFQIINKKNIKKYNETNGLSSNNCKHLIVEPNGIVWVGTNNGINKINTKTGEIDLINNLDGLLSNDINALVLGDETVFVGTSDGLTTFNKNIQTKNKVAPPIYLSKFQIFDKDTVLFNNYILKYNQNNIRIHVTGVSFRSQGNFKYKYRMRGISEDWTETQSNIMSFPILNPDEYVFEAYAINEDGVESEVPIRIKIVVNAPFWQTWWFWFLMGILILFTVWRITQNRIKRMEERLQLENDFQQKINELKMQALQAQMNPHFIFNSLNAIQHYLIVGNGEWAMIYLAKFAKLIRMIFEYSKGLTITLTDEIEFLKLYLELEKLRFKNKIKVSFFVDSDIFTDDFKIPSLLIQPIIENSFKHGLLHKERDSQVKIHFTNKNGWLKCIVEDNGIGREKSKTLGKHKNEKHNSSGMKITEQRLNIWINQHQTVDKKIDCFKVFDLKNADENASGTRVEMILGKIEME